MISIHTLFILSQPYNLTDEKIEEKFHEKFEHLKEKLGIK